MKKYTVDYFINKFSAIPAKYWTIGSFGSGKTHCALGHCGVTRDKTTTEGLKLTELFDNNQLPLTGINDLCGYVGKYDQSTPKKRILAALQDIKKKEAKA